MNNIQSKTNASLSDLQPAPRLLVLVPESEVDLAAAAQKIWTIAKSLEGGIQFIGLCKDAANESTLRRQLVTLSAMVGNEHISVKSRVEFGDNWLQAVKPEWRHGDVIACFAEPRSFLSHRSLSQILESNLNATVFVLAGLYQREKSSRFNWTTSAAAWSGSIGLILGFVWLQIKINQLPQDWAQSTLLYLSLFAEAAAIWAWNSFIG